MTASNFTEALSRLLVHEGGLVNHPADPGGLTNKGITQRVYDAYRARKGQPPWNVREITPDEVEEIYRLQYWSKVQGDKLPAGVDYVVFDGAVNSGPAQSVKWLQRALGVSDDGVIGEVTLDAVEQHPDHDRLIAEIVYRRMLFLESLKTWSVFGRGWSHRVNEVEAIGQAWASGSVGPDPNYHDGGNRKATLSDAKKPPAKGIADMAVGVGTATGAGGSLGLDQARDALMPLAGKSATIDTIIAVLVIGGVLVTIAGLAYRVHASRQAERLADALGAA